MRWTDLIKSRPHSRLLNYLADPEHDRYGPPTIEMIAAELRTDIASALHLLRPLLGAQMVLAEPDPSGIAC